MAVVTITGSDVSGGSPSGGGVGGASNLTTAGAVPYVASAGVLTQAATGLFYDSAAPSLKAGVGKIGTGSASRAEFSYNTFFAGSNFALIQDANAKTYLNSSVAYGLAFSLSNTEVARFAATTGNLLLGTTTDDGSNKLQVAGSVIATGTNNFTGVGASATNVLQFQWNDAGSYGKILTRESATYYDNTIVLKAGNVIVGSATVGNYKLDIAASGSSGTLRVKDSTPTTGATSMLVDIGAAQTAASTVLTLNGVMKYAGTNSTGAGSALLGANSPASTLTAPYTWITVITSDGSTGFIPVWK